MARLEAVLFVAEGALPPRRLAQLASLADETPASVSPIVGTWHGFLLVHRDEPARALRLVAAPEPGQARVGYPFSPTSRHMVAGYAQALLGEPAAALREFDLMTEAARRALLVRDVLRAVKEWEAEHGALTAEELRAADAALDGASEIAR